MKLKFILSQIVSIPTGYAFHTMAQYTPITILAWTAATIAILFALKN
ncbi:MAG: hypothetical protein LBE70_05365 [Nitrososphaerota archaeon]|nr:hypothetical protein [Nitrososphaerota archaeon]